MARQVKRLTALGVKNLSKPGRYADGDGLYLYIPRPGTKTWVFRYRDRMSGKHRDKGLGPARDVSLEQARNAAQEMRAALRSGVDPIDAAAAARAAAAAEAKRAVTFDQCVARYISAHGSSWKNAKHASQWKNTLATYASPVLGAMPVGAIELQHVEMVLEPIWNEKNETASRVRGRIEAILDWAKVGGYRTGENPARWKGNLEFRLSRRGKVHKVRSHPALPLDDMYRFMLDLRGRESIAARALEFLILTATRSNEVRAARWDEVDVEAGVWSIPADRMKMDRDHRVLLSRQAIQALNAIPRLAGGALLFPSPYGGGELSDATLAALVKRMHSGRIDRSEQGYVDPKQLGKGGLPRVVVPHGFRSTFRDWVGERTFYPGDMAEMALAHRIDDKTEAAYRRGDMLQKRMSMMAEWAEFIDNPVAPAIAHDSQAQSSRSPVGVLQPSPQGGAD